ncbi:PadR family transcriptional regulator [Paenibacillus puerhi]|uniref:PadR family transcriptional regulator n=1 Tax=Paenibacillus puerhi TaxID=2692622 RepID=UPI00135B6A12|nr:PadR family transcriptional regulator [Paenibacillus puerhi]
MYELFVLGELMTGKKHGYMLQDVLKNSVGLGRKLSSGTLYPLLTRMTEQGWITLLTEEETKGGRTKKIFDITEVGRDRFLQLMKKPFDSTLEGETELMLQFKLVYFQYVAKEVRLSSLEQYLLILEKNFKHITDFESALATYQPEPEKQRVQLLRALDRQARLREVDIQWIKEEIERVRTQPD